MSGTLPDPALGEESLERNGQRVRRFYRGRTGRGVLEGREGGSAGPRAWPRCDGARQVGETRALPDQNRSFNSSLFSAGSFSVPSYLNFTSTVLPSSTL